MPPHLAPIQVVIVPIFRTEEEKTPVMEAVDRVKADLAGLRVKVDVREGLTPGFKFNDWEMRGVPLRIEIGPKDVQNHSVALARRDIPGRDGKAFVSQDGLHQVVEKLLEEIQLNLLRKATQFRDDHIFDPKDYAEMKQVLEQGWAYSYWCGSKECEDQVKNDTKATTRCIPLNQSVEKGKCIVCGQEAAEKVYFARSY
jgi:prolyl-tRNA synthetase